MNMPPDSAVVQASTPTPPPPPPLLQPQLSTTISQHQLQHPLILPLHLSVLFLSLLLPPFPGRRDIAIALILATYIPTITSPISTDPTINYGVATLWTVTLRVLAVHIFTFPHPEAVFYRLKKGEKPAVAQLKVTSKVHEKEKANKKEDNGKEKVIARETTPELYSITWKKFCWVMSLFWCPRGIGWNYQIPLSTGSVVPSSHPTPISKLTYVIHLFKRLLTLYILLDVTRTYWFTNPKLYISPLDHDPNNTPPIKSLGIPIILRPLVYALSNGILSSSFIQLQYHLLSIPFIFLLNNDFSSWPPLFGSFTEAYTLGNLWGHVWHQLIRTTVTPWGDKVFEILGFGGYKNDAIVDPNTLARQRNLKRIIRVIIGFSLSALGHSTAVFIGSQRQFGKDSLKFFVMQAVGVLLEMAIIELYKFARSPQNSTPADNTSSSSKKELGWGSWQRYIGYMWVLVWLSWTGKWQAADMRRLGLALRGEPVPWSLCRWALGWPQRIDEVWDGYRELAVDGDVWKSV